MATLTLQTVCRQLRNLAGAQDAAGLTDRQLLQRFVETHDEAAFAALLKRHGPMVLGVCRRVLGNHADAEDAAQATFLVLARQAASTRAGEALAGWLYGTAYRSALALRRQSARRLAHERKARPPARPGPELEAALGELQALLDEEVQRLPETLRAPFVLCCLEGLSKPEAAGQLGWKEGTVSGRLARARERLRQRLARRGVALPSALCALALTSAGASAAVPPALAENTVRAAVALAAGRGLVAGARVAAVVRQLTHGLALARIKPLAGLLLAAGLAVATAVGLAGPAPTPGPPPRKPAAAEAKAPDAAQPRSDALGDPLPAGAVARLGTTRLRHESGVEAVAYSADGKRLFSAGRDGELRVWDAATGKALHALRTHVPLGLGPLFGASVSLAVSPDGTTAALGASDGIIYVWDLATGQLRSRLQGHTGPVRALAFSPGGGVLASAGPDKTVRLWELASGKPPRRLRGHTDAVRAVAFSPDGKRLASAGEDRGVRLWDAATGKELRTLKGHGAPVNALAFSPDGALLASGGEDRVVRFWDPGAGMEVRRLGPTRCGVRDLAFAPAGKWLAVACWLSDPNRFDGELRLWDVATGKEGRRLGEAGEPISAVAFAPDGKALAAGASLAVRVWDVATGKERRLGYYGPVMRLAFAPDGGTVLLAATQQALALCDARTGRELRRLPGEAGAFTPDSRTVLAVRRGQGTELVAWEAATGRELRKLPWPGAGAFVAFTADGESFAGLGRDGLLRMWESRTGRELRRFPTRGKWTWPLTFSPDGSLLAWGGAGPGVVLLDTASGRELRRLGNDIGTRKLCFSPDGSLLAVEGLQGGIAASGGGRIRLWEVPSGRERPPLVTQDKPGDLGPIHPTFSPDGRTLALGTLFGDIILCELATGRERVRLRGHRGVITGFAFSADGRRLVSGSADTTALVWDLTVAGRAGPAARELTVAELGALWEDLRGADAPRAYQAILKLTADAGRAVPLLSKYLRPVARLEGGQVEQRVAELASPRFATRQKATAELEKLGDAAEAALRKALASPLAPEVQLRVRSLLERIATDKDGTRLRQTRALEVLERAGTPEARRLLRELAAGAPGARLTEEARQGLRRLGEQFRAGR